MARDDCCESCEDTCPCIGGFPQLWTLFILFVAGGGATLGSALYALISHRTSVLHFAWSAPYLQYINTSVLGTAVGAATLSLALLTWCAFRGNACSALFKAGFAAVLLACVVANAAVAAGAIKVYNGLANQRTSFSEEFDAAWRRDVAAPGPASSSIICDVQKVLKCQGYLAGDCTGTRAAVEERCDRRCPEPTPIDKYENLPCYFFAKSFYRRWNLPLAVCSIFSAVFNLVAFVILMFKVSFNLARQKGNM